MSMHLTTRIKTEILNEEKLEELIIRYFNLETINKKEVSDQCITYYDCYKQHGVSITFVEKKKPPYNIWDSDILNNEYEHSQTVIFDIDTSQDITEIFKDICEFCCYIFKKIRTEMLITSDMYDGNLFHINSDGVMIKNDKVQFLDDNVMLKFNKIING